MRRAGPLQFCDLRFHRPHGGAPCVIVGTIGLGSGQRLRQALFGRGDFLSLCVNQRVGFAPARKDGVYVLLRHGKRGESFFRRALLLVVRSSLT